MSMPKYSVIIPVFDRPQELEELLQSLGMQTYQNFEVLVVDDGSTLKSDAVYEKFTNRLNLKYFYKQNSGPGPSRNFGFERAKGQYFLVFDSDCVLPPGYFNAVEEALSGQKLDMWGGPDRARDDFTPLQQAMGYTMSSILTTGGIRGGRSKAFQPRSFNMGLSRKVFEATGGFRLDRYAEDIELSVRVTGMGFKVGLIPEAFVFHKRRTTLRGFFRQVSNFGKGRVIVGRTHRGVLRLTHWFPAFFLIGLIAIPPVWLVLPFVGAALFSIYVAYIVAVFADTALKSRDIWVALLSMPCVMVQMTGYGSGFLKEFFKTGK
jgi:glycosyltransferase involved in cell wall biosynthesis